jgi:hypothetical protein
MINGAMAAVLKLLEFTLALHLFSSTALRQFKQSDGVIHFRCIINNGHTRSRPTLSVP